MRHLIIIVSGMVAGNPGQGGATWAVLQYALGFRQLGHEVYRVEPVKGPASPAAAHYFRQVTKDFGLEGRAGMIADGSNETVGVAYDQLRAVAGKADVLINISGMLRREDLIGRIPIRVFLDLDPAFNQLWHTQGIDMGLADHNRFVTIGSSIGREGCPIPTCSREWIHSFQPIVLSYWNTGARVVFDGLTTVGNWRAYGSIQHDGISYGQKAHSLRPYIELPSMTSERFMPSFAIHPGEHKDLDALRRNGWQLLNPAVVASTPRQYQHFVGSSKAEFGIAKSGYVVSQSGWFSDRSVCYLASGRPVIAQETQFSRYLPCGEGLFAFRRSEDVLSAIESINSDYPRHCVAARCLALEYFDSDKVLSKLLTAVEAR